MAIKNQMNALSTIRVDFFICVCMRIEEIKWQIKDHLNVFKRANDQIRECAIVSKQKSVPFTAANF